MTQALLVAGGGIGGLAAALAARRAGWEARVFEQADAFSEQGAGIQLGPNVTRILAEWGFDLDAPDLGTARPRALRVRDAVDGSELARLRLDDFDARYGAPYCTVHRSDLHRAILRAATLAGVNLHTSSRIAGVAASAQEVQVTCENGRMAEADALVGADGIWSVARASVTGTAPARPTGHVAWRALCPRDSLPVDGRDVTAWLGPAMHMVTYPVRGGEWINVVCVTESTSPMQAQGWDQAADARTLAQVAKGLCRDAWAVVNAVPQWRCWALHDRPPLQGASEMARGRIALLGDAAHPMLPYLAQGAGMAIEDARELQRVLRVADGRTLDVPAALTRYALSRWQRCARVQARSQRNGRIFHAGGVVRLGRNASLRLLGARLLDVPWLYGG